jgi:hypothetical protein
MQCPIDDGSSAADGGDHNHGETCNTVADVPAQHFAQHHMACAPQEQGRSEGNQHPHTN